MKTATQFIRGLDTTHEEIDKIRTPGGWPIRDAPRVSDTSPWNVHQHTHWVSIHWHSNKVLASTIKANVWRDSLLFRYIDPGSLSSYHTLPQYHESWTVHLQCKINIFQGSAHGLHQDSITTPRLLQPNKNVCRHCRHSDIHSTFPHKMKSRKIFLMSIPEICSLHHWLANRPPFTRTTPTPRIHVFFTVQCLLTLSHNVFIHCPVHKGNWYSTGDNTRNHNNHKLLYVHPTPRTSRSFTMSKQQALSHSQRITWANHRATTHLSPAATNPITYVSCIFSW